LKFCLDPAIILRQIRTFFSGTKTRGEIPTQNQRRFCGVGQFLTNYRLFWVTKVGLGISRKNANSLWNPVYNTQGISLNSLLWKQNNFFSSNVNVILTLQTCGQRSSMSVGSKRRALAFHVCAQLCHMFLISICRGA